MTLSLGTTYLVAVPGSAAQQLVVLETPASPHKDVVPSTPVPAPASQPLNDDPVLSRMVRANAEGFRKRRLALELSPEFQVSQPPPKHRLVNAKLDISCLFE
jgi:hypothetical protein